MDRSHFSEILIIIFKFMYYFIVVVLLHNIGSHRKILWGKKKELLYRDWNY